MENGTGIVPVMDMNRGGYGYGDGCMGGMCSCGLLY